MQPFTKKQKWIIATPLLLALAFSFFVFILTMIGRKELANITQELLTTKIIQYFFLTLINLIPASILSLLLGIYAYNSPKADGSMSWLLACGLVGGYFPVIWFYWIYYFSGTILYPVAIALYGLPTAYLFGMISGYTIGRMVLFKFPNLFK